MIEQLERELELLERHLQILALVAAQQPIGIVNLSDETGYPHHKVRYSLRILEEEELIEPSSQGAMTTDQAGEFLDDHESRLNTIIADLEAMAIEQ